MRGGHWKWEPYGQFLDSRGYIVIEPEFRGSTGLMLRWIHGSDQSDEVRAFDLPTLLLAIGGRDARVLPVHGHQLRDALQAAGRLPTWIEYPVEGHGWFYPHNRADFARRLQAFLAEHLR